MTGSPVRIVGALLLACNQPALGRAPAAAQPQVHAGFYSMSTTSGPCPLADGPVFVGAEGTRAITLKGKTLRTHFRPGPTPGTIIDGGCTLRFEHNDLTKVRSGPLVLAHRGDARRYPANTVEAFEEALRQGFPGFEVDVRISADGHAVASHDERLEAATRCSGSVSKKSLEFITKCKAVRSPVIPESRFLARRAAASAAVPSLAGVLDRFLCDERVARIVLDLKVPDDARLANALERAMPRCATSSSQSRLTLITLSKIQIDELRQRFSAAQIALESDKTVSGLIDEPVSAWFALDFDTLSLSFNSLHSPALRLIKLVRGDPADGRRNFDCLYHWNRRQLRPRHILAWTVSSRATIRKAAAYRFELVLTDATYSQFVGDWLSGDNSPQTSPENCPLLDR